MSDVKLTGHIWRWHDDYKGAPEDGKAWVEEPRAAIRVGRGGSWDFDARNCRSAYRNGHEPEYRNQDLGFRVAAVQDKQVNER